MRVGTPTPPTPLACPLNGPACYWGADGILAQARGWPQRGMFRLLESFDTRCLKGAGSRGYARARQAIAGPIGVQLDIIRQCGISGAAR